ncbi:MAG TPA: hypothetical protein VFO21_01145 [Vicinamibacterales bacterium]|jgi:hypothetical protein|nr:hypothetical protein [Vicinamibacterales bacterium]
MKRKFQLAILMWTAYALSLQTLRADAYCDDWIAGCEAGLKAGKCEDIFIATCNPNNHDDKTCRCGS